MLFISLQYCASNSLHVSLASPATPRFIQSSSLSLEASPIQLLLNPSEGALAETCLPSVQKDYPTTIMFFLFFWEFHAMQFDHLLLSSMTAIPTLTFLSTQLHILSLYFFSSLFLTHWIPFMLPKDSWVWGLPWSLVTPLKKKQAKTWFFNPGSY